MTEPKAFEDITIDEFAEYEAVRQMGQYNMFDPRARRQSGLDEATYVGIMKHYAELAQKWPEVTGK